MNISHLTYDKIIQNTFIDSLKIPNLTLHFKKLFIYLTRVPRLSHTRSSAGQAPFLPLHHRSVVFSIAMRLSCTVAFSVLRSWALFTGEVVRGHESCSLPASENIFIRMLKCRQAVKSVLSLGQQAVLRWIADTVWFDGSRETDSTPITIYIRRYRTGTRCRCNGKGEEGKSFSTVNATCN